MYEVVTVRRPEQAELLRVIQESTEFGSPPFVVAPHVSEELRIRLQNALIDLDQRPEGIQILKGLDTDRLVALPDSAYDSVRALTKKVGEGP